MPADLFTLGTSNSHPHPANRRSGATATLRRWFWRRMESLSFVLFRAPTLLAWDWRAASRILISEPNPP